MSKPQKYVFGIDEAGRGPVIGPMVFGLAYCPESYITGKVLDRAGINDSKKLTPEQRERILETMKGLKDLHYMTRVVSAKEISTEMLKINRKSLNDISFDAVIGLIRALLAEAKGKFIVDAGFFDAIGKTDTTYLRKLREAFGEILPFKACVSVGGDAKYKIVGAASIAAKVERDRLVREIETEYNSQRTDPVRLGSGYPGDPETKKYLQAHCDSVFLSPGFIRYSWGTIEGPKAIVRPRECLWREDVKHRLPTKDTLRAKEYTLFRVGHIDEI